MFAPITQDPEIKTQVVAQFAEAGGVLTGFDELRTG
jgi:hypothetical protein